MTRVSNENLARFRDKSALTIAPAWQASHNYVLGEIITYKGRRKRCMAAHQSGTTFDTSKWENVDVESALGTKANKDGSYKTLTSGNAYNLIDEHATGINREFIFDTAAGTASIAGDGTASVESIKGNTLVWNQLVNDDTTSVDTISGHKYFTRISGIASIITSSGSAISCADTDNVIDLTKMFGADKEPSTVEEFEAMFPLNYYSYNAGELLNFNGTGIKTIGFNAFNLETGKAKLLANNQYQITGTYTSATSDAETITIDADGKFTPAKNGTLIVVGGDNTTCVHLVWSGYRNGEYEAYWEQTKNLPNLSHFDVQYTGADGETHVLGGMKSAGTAHDEVVKLPNGKYKAIRRTGVVDLGTINWAFRPASGNYPDCFVRRSSIPFITRSDGELLCIRYNSNYKLTWYLHDKIITNHASFKTYNLIITDSDYTDAASLKASLAGVLLIYELETPVESEEFEWNGNYQVADFGTEALLPENDDEPTTTPFVGVVKYSTDFPREIATLPKNYANMKTIANLVDTINDALNAVHQGKEATISIEEFDDATQSYDFNVAILEPTE